MFVVNQRRSMSYRRPGYRVNRNFVAPKSCEMPDAPFITPIFAIITPILSSLP